MFWFTEYGRKFNQRETNIETLKGTPAKCNPLAQLIEERKGQNIVTIYYKDNNQSPLENDTL